jgi:CheY-like chemotaxis protein
MDGSRFELKEKIDKVLLVSSPYDSYIMEEGHPLLESLHRFKGHVQELVLPTITRVNSGEEALSKLSQTRFDLVISMSRIEDMSAFRLCDQVKALFPSLPFYLLSQYPREIEQLQIDADSSMVNHVFVWTGNPDLFFSMIQCCEDELFLKSHTSVCQDPYLLVVEDSALFLSTLVPVIYQEIYQHLAQVFHEDSVSSDCSEKMKARPKILIARNYVTALFLYQKYQEEILCVLSDNTFRFKGIREQDGGIRLLTHIRDENPDLPLSLMSSDIQMQRRAQKIGVDFFNKGSTSLDMEISTFLKKSLRLGEFIFRMTDGHEIGRAQNLQTLQERIQSIPDECLLFHAHNHDFSRWLIARCEVALGRKFRSRKIEDFEDVSSLRDFLILSIRDFRETRFRGIVTSLVPGKFDEAVPFCKIGIGSLGGKGRGLAFLSRILGDDSSLHSVASGVCIQIPQTLVIATGWFEVFLKENPHLLDDFYSSSNENIKNLFLAARLPEPLRQELETILMRIREPLAVRSSSLFEDSHYNAYAGLYSTYFLPNCNPDLAARVERLESAIKLVYASVYFKETDGFASNSIYRREEERMAVILQKVAGKRYGDYFYPWISGVAQSRNFYPVGSMQAQEGIVHISLGLGKSVAEGGDFLSFSPSDPGAIAGFGSPQQSLDRSQKRFYALKMEEHPDPISLEDFNLVSREVSKALNEPPIQALISTYSKEDDCIRDTALLPGPKVVSFARLLKYGHFPIGKLIKHLLNLGEQEFGCSIEMEFSLNLAEKPEDQDEFNLLQIRPMASPGENHEMQISRDNFESALCYSDLALGNGISHDLFHIVYVKPDPFEVACTDAIATEIEALNKDMKDQAKKYFLIGPGRWGSSDRRLGIPISWASIDQAGAIAETWLGEFQPAPSLGSHLFYNLITHEIYYFNIRKPGPSIMNWDWLQSQAAERETAFLRLISLKLPLEIKVDGKKNHGVVLLPD